MIPFFSYDMLYIHIIVVVIMVIQDLCMSGYFLYTICFEKIAKNWSVILGSIYLAFSGSLSRSQYFYDMNIPSVSYFKKVNTGC